MIIENLSQLYPKGYLSKTIGSEATYSIPVDDQFFIVNKAFLSIKEQHLLEALFPISENPTITGNHPWFSYLFQQAKLPAEGTFRMLQIQTNVTKELQAEWQFNLTKMFPDTVDCFSPSNNMYILVEEQSKNTFQQEEIQGIFLTLDTDFDCTSAVFVGNFYSSEDILRRCFHEEQRIFSEELNSSSRTTVFSLTDVALHYFTKEAMSQNVLVEYYRRLLNKDTDIQLIISALWKNQGNISSTAKDLFMHRNTLHYRLEKFFEQTGLSLKKMDDLIFCYLLLRK